MLKNKWTGIGLAFQFFTIMPIPKQLDLTKKTVTHMFQFLPWLGALFGAIVAFLYYELQQTELSPLFIGFVLVMAFIIMTGGLHLDGFVDMGDAYFSYRDLKKRQEILDDPRIGAFGAMALLFLVLTKIIVMTELVTQQKLAYAMFVFVPFVVRAALGFYIVITPPSKEKGLGYFFRTHILTKPYMWMTILSLVVGTAAVMYVTNSVHALIVVLIVMLFVVLYKKWTMKNFGGASGDLYGAWVEGMEAIVWIILLCLN